MTVFASSFSHISVTVARAFSASLSARSSSITLPCRTPSTPSNPSWPSACRTASPCGSRTPFLSITCTRAFMVVFLYLQAARCAAATLAARSVDQRRAVHRCGALGHHAKPVGHFGIGVRKTTQIAAEHVLVQFLTGLDVPQATAIGADLVSDDEALEIPLIDAADLDLEIHQTNADAIHDPRQEIVDAQRKAQDVVHILLAGPSEGGDMFLGDQWIAQLVVLDAIFHDRTRQLRALVHAKPFGHGARRIIAHDDFKRHDLAGAHQLLTHVQPLQEMIWDTDIGQAKHEIFRQQVVQHTLALDHIPLFGIEGGRVILEVLDKRSRLGALVQCFRLAFVNFLAPRHADSVSGPGPTPLWSQRCLSLCLGLSQERVRPLLLRGLSCIPWKTPTPAEETRQ